MYVQMGTATGRSSNYCLLCGIISCCPVTEKPYRLKIEKKIVQRGVSLLFQQMLLPWSGTELL